MHPLLRDLGPEPLEEHFSAEYLKIACTRRALPCLRSGGPARGVRPTRDLLVPAVPALGREEFSL